ncbi:hypothetical protein ABK040_011800 [Willaertia magna]
MYSALAQNINNVNVGFEHFFTKKKVIDLYKRFISIIPYYPLAENTSEKDLKEQLKNAFLKNKNVSSSEEIEKLINHGNYVYKEVEALIRLKKYRSLNKRYSNKDDADEKYTK